VHGTWQSARIVPGSASLNVGQQAAVSSVVCSSAGNCTATGDYGQRKDTATYEYSAPFVVSETHGKWGTAREAPGSLARAGYVVMRDLSCASAGNCTAVGYAISGGLYVGEGGGSTGPQRAFAISQVHGTWRDMTAVTLPRALRKKASFFNSVSCVSAGNCTAGGVGGTTGIIASQVRGTWHTAAEVPGLAALNHGGAGINVLSCSSPGTCSAGGGYMGSHSHNQSFVVSEVGGRWGRALEVAGALNTGQGGLNALSCTASGFCSAAGFYYASPRGHVYVISRG
jgi:hypothetical protein